jgi:putative inorganic carbon (HCO3(-)) transporter
VDKNGKLSSFLDTTIGLFLVIVIFSIPFPEHIQTIETLCFSIIIFAFIAKLILRYPLKSTRIDLPVFIFTIFVIISIFFSVDYLYSLHEFRKYWLRPILLACGIVNFAVNEKRIGYLVWAVVISSLAPIAFGITQYFTEGIQLKSMFGASTEFGQYLDYFIPFMFAMILWYKAKIPKISLGLILAGAFFCLIFTYTRASWISIFIAIIFLCFIKNRKLALIPIVLLLIFIIFSPYTIKNRITSITNGNVYLKRIYLLETTVDQIKKKPLTGYGWGYHNFHDLYPSFLSPELKTLAKENPEWLDIYHAHNYPLQIAFEIGILGSVVFLWLWVTIMILTWKSFVKLQDPFLKSITIGIFSAFIACSIHWFVEVPSSKQLIMILWTFIGISMAIFNITEEKWEKKTL